MSSSEEAAKKHTISHEVHNDVARMLKKLCTLKNDYWNKQWFSSFASLFKMGTSLKGKNLLPGQFLMVWKITFTTLGAVLEFFSKSTCPIGRVP